MVADPSKPSQGSVEALYAIARQWAPPARAAAIEPAVAVVLWRRAAAGFELFLVRRAASMAFLGGFWCFPGGRVDERDRSPEAAAVRELAEETGVQLDPGALVRTAEWVTPDFAPLRYRAPYFLAEAPDGAEPDVAASAGELDAGLWITPARALERIAVGEVVVPSPVVRTLRALAPGREGAEERLAAEADAEARAPQAWPLAPTVTAVALRTPTLPPATHTGCYLLGDRQLIVVDPASPSPDQQAALDAVLDDLRAAGREVVAVWLTHHHADHVGGAERVAERLGVPIEAHAETRRLLAGRVRVDRDLVDGERRDLGDTVVEVVFTPGHAPGHLCFVDARTRFAVAGDMVAGVGTIVIDPDEGDMAAYLASLERLRALDARALLPAHGGPILDVVGKIDGYLRHRRWREERVVQALAAAGPATARALVPEVYADTPAALHGLAERSLLAHLRKLEADGAAAVDGDLWRPL